MKFPNIFTTLALASACMAAPGRASTVSISPNQAEAGVALTVQVSGKTVLCMPIWSNISAKESGGILVLEAAGANNPLAKCTAGPHPFTVDVPVPALKAGEYEVRFQLRLPCEFQNPQCLPFIFPDTAGTLIVTDRAKLSYAIKPRAAPADKAFDLFVTHKNFTCGNTYSNLEAVARGWQLFVSFTNKPNPAALCPAVETDYGPTFKVPALANGTYQVMVNSVPYCDTKPCPLTGIPPQLAGALEIGGRPTDRKAWTEPGLATAGMAFGLELHGPYVCNVLVTDKQVEVKDGTILLRYGVMLTRRACPDTVYVHHEVFTVPGLAVGSYPVLLAPRDCPTLDDFLCAESKAPWVIDTVTATSSLGLRTPSGKPGAVGAVKRNGVRVKWRGVPADLSGRRKE